MGVAVSSKLRVVFAITLASLLLMPRAVQAAGNSDESLSVSQVVGIWRMCYESKFKGEIDAGYLVLTPDRRFVHLVDACCGQPIIIATGRFSIDGPAIILHPETGSTAEGREAPGRMGPERLNYLRERLVRFVGDANAPALRAVLAGGSSPNYGYAKVF